MKNRVIGFGGYDLESSAVLMEDGEIISAIQEERLNRQKHCGGFPYNAINHIFNTYDLSVDEIDAFAFPFTQDHKFFVKEAISNVYKRPLKTLKNYKLFNSNLKYRIGRYQGFRNDLTTVFLHKLKLKSNKIKYFNHHKCHFASAHFTSGFDNSVGLIIDLEGDGDATTGWVYKDNKIKKIMNYGYPNSLGIFYNRFTQYLGFKTHDEYKVMGLAAYGKPRFQKEIEELLMKTPEGYKLNLKYFNPFSGYYFSDHLYRVLGPAYPNHNKVDDRMADIACSMQSVFETILVHLIELLKKKTTSNNFVMAGGCSLNSKANGIILKKKIFENFHISSSAGDCGVALGAAYLETFEKNKLLKSKNIKNDDFGPEFSDHDVEIQLKRSLISYEKIEKPQKVCAELLAKGLIIGWFQGKMEYGPRALGNRSIFAHAIESKMKDKINAAIKFREPFRPFAPICIDGDKEEYFDAITSSPFMTFTVNVKKEKQKLIPAIVHEDGTARLQTVEEQSNKLVYELLIEYKKITGIPIIVNTSFNVAGEPIVCTPLDAIKTFYISGLDALIINNFLIKK